MEDQTERKLINEIMLLEMSIEDYKETIRILKDDIVMLDDKIISLEGQLNLDQQKLAELKKKEENDSRTV